MKYQVGDILHEIGTPYLWEVENVNPTLGNYDVVNQVTGNRYTSWPQWVIENDTLYELVESPLVVDATYMVVYRPSDLYGLHVKFVGEIIKNDKPTYHFLLVTTNDRWPLAGDDVYSPVAEFDMNKLKLVDTPHVAYTTCSVPATNEGDALMEFFATPQGQWKGWSDV